MTMTTTRTFSLVAVILAASAVLALLPAITLAAVEKTDGFVCPVISTDAVLNSPRGAAIGEGHYSIIGPSVSVPLHATNGDGAGTPPGPHSEPGDTDYTAIWAGQ